VTGTLPTPAAIDARALADLTGRSDGPPRAVPRRLLTGLGRPAASLARSSEAFGRRVDVDPMALLTERAQLLGLSRQGSTSCGGSTRLIRCRSGWLAVCLARGDDIDLVPAWLSRWVDPTDALSDPWPVIEQVAASAAATELLDAADGLGLPVAVVGERPPTPEVVVETTRSGTHPQQLRPGDGESGRLRVVDLSSLWAGPLCGALLAEAGLRVTKVESADRPDGTRAASVAFDERLNGAKDRVIVDLSTAGGVARLRELVHDADVVIEGSRPRALTQLGLDVDALLASPAGPHVWISITGFGREQPDRVAFGDVAAAAGGLVGWDALGPVFVGDAIADPLAGLVAAAAAFEALASGARGRIDVSMADVAASFADPLPPVTRPRRREATGLLLRDVEVDGRRTSVLVDQGRIVSVGDELDRSLVGEEVDGARGALIPGLHDHHLHLAGTAALDRSVAVRPSDVRDRAGLARRLTQARLATPAGGWIRAVGYHESVAGDLDRHVLDRLVPDHPIRVQDASGARWTVNTLGARRLGLDHVDLDGIGRDAGGRATGRLHRLDTWVRHRIEAEPPDFAPLGRLLGSFGVTGVTDTTPYESYDGFELLAEAVDDGSLPQQVMVTGGIDLAEVRPPTPLRRGPVKLVIDDVAHPSPVDLAHAITRSHAAERPIAMHCVTRVALAVLLAAFDIVGARPGDRIEHGSVIAPDHFEPIRRLGLTVVTQPTFVAERGDRYLADVDPDDVPHLYRCRSLIEAGIPVALGTDAPHGNLDPWHSIAAAVTRRTAASEVLGEGERVPPEVALRMFLTSPDDPGGAPRRIAVGGPADLCLLHVPLAEALRSPSSTNVRHTWFGGDRGPSAR
jgi:predicted amidohydrolase YtcJ